MLIACPVASESPGAIVGSPDLHHPLMNLAWQEMSRKPAQLPSLA
jgi:hypothetical protein